MKTLSLHVRHPWVRQHLDACKHENKQGVIMSCLLEEMRKHTGYTITLSKGNYFNLHMADTEATLFIIKWGTDYTSIKS